MASPFRPALVVVDFQNDFCPPNGALAVPDGRDIAPTINTLMSLPFTIRIATQDWHPASHISFASSHPPPNNQPITSRAVVPNPLNLEEKEEITLWPDHCIQHTHGAAFVPEFEVDKVDEIVQKGMDAGVEMLSAFRDTYKAPCVRESGLKDALKQVGVTHCYVVGLAWDYCVKWTAIHAAEAGWETFVVKEGVRAVDGSEEAVGRLTQELEAKGVRTVEADGEEVRWVREWKKELERLSSTK
jgi:nicotinamidase-related amidase